MGLGPNWYQIGNKSCYMPKVSKFYIEKTSKLAGLKVSSLLCSPQNYRQQEAIATKIAFQVKIIGSKNLPQSLFSLKYNNKKKLQK